MVQWFIPLALLLLRRLQQGQGSWTQRVTADQLGRVPDKVCPRAACDETLAPGRVAYGGISLNGSTPGGQGYGGVAQTAAIFELSGCDLTGVWGGNVSFR